MAAQEGTVTGKKEKNTGMAIIAYIIFFIPLLTDAKNDPFVKFHVKQGLALFIFGVAGSIICSVLTAVLIGLLLAPLLSIAVLVLAIIGIINASQGVEKDLPVIGKLIADKLKF